MADDDGSLDLDGARTTLYGVAPREFVAVRADLAKRARAAGDKPLATAIMALRKPTLSAWLVNVLARERQDALGELLELGRDLREGMGGVDADGLRDLTRRRHQLVAGLVSQARELGADAGQRVADDAARGIQATLEATLADADSADAVAAGCLSEPLEPSGFGGFGLLTVDQPSAPRARAQEDSGATVTDLGDRRARREAEIGEAEQGLADAQALAQQAERAYAQAQQQVADEMRRVDRASDRLAKVEAKLTEARAEVAERSAAAKTAQQAESDAEKSLRAATRALAAATEQLRRLRR
jgi:hypothetical protein